MRGLFLLSLGAILVLGSGCSLTEESVAEGAENLNQHTISVVGYGEAQGTPDTALIQLGVSVVEEDVGSAVDQVNRLTDQITSAMVALGIEGKDIQTTNYSVWPEDRFDPESRIATGERVFHVDSNMVIIVREHEKVGKVLGAGLLAGANNVSGISFGIQDTSSLIDEARAQAIADAKQRAQQLAEGLDVHLGAPIVVSESTGGGGVGWLFPYQIEKGMGGGGGPPVSPGQSTLSIQVQVTFELVP